MDLNQLFQVALGINQPWFIDIVCLDELNSKVEINLTLKQKVALESILAEYTQSGQAYKFKLGFQDLFKLKSRAEAELYLNDWLTSIKESKIPQMKKLGKSITRQWDGILNWFDNKISNRKVEALNCGIQNLKRRAKGFRTLANFQALIYLVMGKLRF